MDMKLNVVYEITKGDSWRSAEGFAIKSNIADDNLIDCQIAKSLVEHLKEESVMLEPDKLLLSLAEAQKRGIEENINDLDDLELNAKNRADSIHEKLLKTFQDSEKKFEELELKFSETSNRFVDKISKTKDSLDSEVEYLSSVSAKLNKVDGFSLERLSETLKALISLVEKDPELVKLVLENKIKD